MRYQSRMCDVELLLGRPGDARAWLDATYGNKTNEWGRATANSHASKNWSFLSTLLGKLSHAWVRRIDDPGSRKIMEMRERLEPEVEAHDDWYVPLLDIELTTGILISPASNLHAIQCHWTNIRSPTSMNRQRCRTEHRRASSTLLSLTSCNSSLLSLLRVT